MQKYLKTLIMVLAVILIISAIFFINKYKNNTPLDETVLTCITSNSILYASTTCGHCALQKEMLQPYLNKFTIIDCLEQRDKCLEANIQVVPTWIIHNQKYLGKKSLKELKELTGC